MRAFNRTSTSKGSNGASLVEFLLVLPIFLLLVTAIFSIGRLLWQIQVLTDAAKYGARQAVSFSKEHPDAGCEALREVARTASEKYRNQNSKWGLTKIWNVCAGFSPNFSFDGMNLRFVSVSMTTKDEDNCLFCYQGFLKRILPSTSASFDLAVNSACITESPNLACK